MTPWRLRLKVAVNGLAAVLKRPAYLALGVLAATAVLGVFVWVSNLSLLGYVLSDSSTGILDKLLFVLQGYESVFINFTNGTGLVIALFALLAGINVALIAFLIRSKIKLTGSGKGMGATIAAAIGAGCAACGTSILAPLLAGAGATASIGLTETIGIAANIIGVLLMTYSIIGLGGQAATAIAKQAE